ncbi:MAG TPA: 1-acyl-sn-glycerol-3-phosphate acyltransferase [Brumimicrobium sp.]|nr:1-acyl-sn-glycerol-3-phosphate acyltransferase [Brumimicrobium sp.]
MRPLYFLLKFPLKVLLWIYYPRFKNINPPKKMLSRTIYMSNHAASFMDPLTVAGTQLPIIFFMTRSDIFTPLMKPILWAAHMFPIYRQHDGEDTKKKNEEVFKKCSRVLKNGKSLLVFSEGFTDDVFIRRLKPIKKGAVRMGFLALETNNWNKKLFIQAVGVNYSNPNTLGSDCLVANGKPVCLNDFKSEYEQDPNKTIHVLTNRLEQEMRDLITDIRDKNMAPFHENVMRLTRKGMNENDSDKSISLVNRWKYSKRLSAWFNSNEIENNAELMALKVRLENYFERLKKIGIEETPLYKVTSNKRKKVLDVIYLISLSPIMVLGFILNYIPYIIVKRFVENSMKRKVFWGSVKMLVGAIAVGLFNFVLLFIVAKIFDFSFLKLLFAGLFVGPLSAIVAVNWIKTLKLHKKMSKVTKMDVSDISTERADILREIEAQIPVA